MQTYFKKKTTTKTSNCWPQGVQIAGGISVKDNPDFTSKKISEWFEHKTNEPIIFQMFCMTNQFKLIFPKKWGFNLERAQTSEHCYIYAKQRRVHPVKECFFFQLHFRTFVIFTRVVTATSPLERYYEIKTQVKRMKRDHMKTRRSRPRW